MYLLRHSVCLFTETLYVYVLTSVYVFNDTFTETLCMCIYGDNPYSSFLRHYVYILRHSVHICTAICVCI